MVALDDRDKSPALAAFIAAPSPPGPEPMTTMSKCVGPLGGADLGMGMWLVGGFDLDPVADGGAAMDDGVGGAGEPGRRRHYTTAAEGAAQEAGRGPGQHDVVDELNLSPARRKRWKLTHPAN